MFVSMDTDKQQLAQSLLDASALFAGIVGGFLVAVLAARFLVKRYVREDITDQD